MADRLNKTLTCDISFTVIANEVKQCSVVDLNLDRHASLAITNKGNFIRLLYLAFALFCSLVSQAQAAASGGTEHVTVSMVADKTSVAPGDTVTIAIVEDIIPGWHTYWQNPGDSGIPPNLAWDLPAGFVAGPIQWPAPSRLDFGPLVNFGYSGHVVLLTAITVPNDAAIGSQAPLGVKFDWLVCQEVCIPESANLDLQLPVATASDENGDKADLFLAAQGMLTQPLPVTARATVDPKIIDLSIDAPAPGKAFFFPDDSGIIDDVAPQVLERTAKGFSLSLARGDLKQQPLHDLTGVLEFEDKAGQLEKAFSIDVKTETASIEPPPPDVVPASKLTLFSALLLAIAGGVILNLMPCVFPVLSLKILALSRHAHGAIQEARVSGVAYTAGILVAFGVVAAILLALRGAGNAVGWGFQLQAPGFVLCLVYLLFAMGLSLSGFFSISGSFTGFGAGLAAQHGWTGSFFTGALAALVATPCSAPFMGTAIGFAVSQPWPIAFLIVEALGLGLALPYLLLCFNPHLIRHLPRPGLWMERVKQLLAFPLYASAVWLVWVLSLESGPMGVLMALAGAVLIAFAIWVRGISRHSVRRGSRVAGAILALAAIGFLAASIASPVMVKPAGQAATNSFIPTGWEPFSDARLAELQKAGTPVFIDMSAAWCITCMLNERVALGPDTIAALKERGIVFLKGDWTNRDPSITAFLATFSRNGVPLYVFYPGQQKPPVVLPQILTPAIVQDTIGKI